MVYKSDNASSLNNFIIREVASPINLFSYVVSVYFVFLTIDFLIVKFIES